MSQRPKSVSIAAIMSIIIGAVRTIFGFCGVLELLAAQVMQQDELSKHMDSLVPGLRTVQTVLGSLLGWALLAAGIAMLKLAPWTRRLALAAAVVGILFDLVRMAFQILYIWPDLPEITELVKKEHPQQAELSHIVAPLYLGMIFAMIAGEAAYLLIIVIALLRPWARAALSGLFLSDRAILVRGVSLDFVADKVVEYGRLTSPNNPLHHFALCTADGGWVAIGMPHNLNRYNFHNLANWMTGLSSDQQRAAEVVAVSCSESEPENSYYLIPKDAGTDEFIGRREDGASMNVDIPMGDVRVSTERTQLTAPLQSYLASRGIGEGLRPGPQGFAFAPQREFTIPVDDSLPE